MSVDWFMDGNGRPEDLDLMPSAGRDVYYV
jgi:hypothetical protein